MIKTTSFTTNPCYNCPVNKHAKLSASGSSRWLNCPGSVKAEEGYENTTSVYAEEGLRAHELAEKVISNPPMRAEDYVEMKEKFRGKVATDEMARFVQEYVDYTVSFETSDTTLYVEERLDFSNIVPGGFGTADAIILDAPDNTCHVFDLKYGKGVTVNATKNSQMLLYALGVYNEFSWAYQIDKFKLHVVQPRIRNYSQYTISVDDLTDYGKWVSERSLLALQPTAPRVPGEKQCQWCLAKGDCKALYDFTSNIIGKDFENLDEPTAMDIMNDEQKRAVLENRSLIESFINSVGDRVYTRLQEGEDFEGYKLVESRSYRKWAEDAEPVLIEKLGDKAFDRKLISISAAEKLLEQDEVDALTFKPKGKLVIAPSYDKRKEVVPGDVKELFDELGD